MNIQQMAFRNIRRNLRRSLLSVTAIMIAAMSIVMLFSLLAGMKADLNWNIQSFYAGEIRIRHKNFDDNELLNPLHLRVENYKSVMEKLADMPEVAQISPRINFPGIADPNDKNKVALGVGVDFEIEKKFQNLEKYIDEGTLPQTGKNEILMGSTLAKDLQLKVGDKVTILTTTMRRSSNAVTFTVTGIATWPVETMSVANYYAPIDRVEYLTRMGDSALELLVKLVPDTDAALIKPAVQKTLDEFGNLDAKTWKEANTLAAWIDIADMVYSIMAFFFFILASTVIINTTMMVIFERMREIGTIAAMGMKGKEIVNLFFIEAFYLGLIGTAAGVLLGIVFTLILEKVGINFSAAMEGIDMEISSILYPKLNLRSTVGVFFYSLAVASLTSILPTRRAARIEPVEALRHVG